MKILVVEDDRISALVLQKALQKLDHDVTVEPNGQRALHILETNRFHMVISDWMMPEIDGIELCRRIRGNPETADLYVIMLTAKGLAEDRLAGLDAGADDFLVKPLDQGELVARLDVARRMIDMREQVTLNSLHLQELQAEIVGQTSQLGEILVSQGAITARQLQQALEMQAIKHQPLGRIISEQEWATEEHITRALATQMGVPYVDIATEFCDPFALTLVPYDVAKKNCILPLATSGIPGVSGSVLKVATTNPWDIEVIDLLQRLTHHRIEPVLASQKPLAHAIDTAYNNVSDNAPDVAIQDSLQHVEMTSEDMDDLGEEWNADDLIKQSDQAPVIRFVNTLFSDAIRRRASDIHIEPMRRVFQIRYRVDGDLQVIRSVPRHFLPATVSRIKIMADMDISERRLPLDGRLSISLGGNSVDLRISTLPNKYGERMVIRILNRSAATVALSALGLSEPNQALFQGMIQRPHGIILVTGPTGSGKTTTLYAALKALSSSKTNIMTCEDPVEYEMEGINQFNVNERVGLTFARQLRAILRQDPDVVLVGEIRDNETAEIAIRAALTGHLVFSTLHCNDAASAVSRLVDMGVPPFLLAETLIGVVSQRLVRLLCPHCRRELPPEPRLVDYLCALGNPIEYGDLYSEAAGCNQCDNVGSRGRMALHEILVSTSAVQNLIRHGNDTAAIRRASVESGMISMLDDGILKAKRGLITLGDVAKHAGAADSQGYANLQMDTRPRLATVGE